MTWERQGHASHLSLRRKESGRKEGRPAQLQRDTVTPPLAHTKPAGPLLTAPPGGLKLDQQGPQQRHSWVCWVNSQGSFLAQLRDLTPPRAEVSMELSKQVMAMLLSKTVPGLLKPFMVQRGTFNQEITTLGHDGQLGQGVSHRQCSWAEDAQTGFSGAFFTTLCLLC